MSGSILVALPVAGQRPYTDEAIEKARRAVENHRKEPDLGGFVCAACGEEWGANGCSSLEAAIRLLSASIFEIEWRTAAEVPEIAFDFASDVTQVLHIDPAVFHAPRKPSPYPRQLVGAAS